MQPDTDNARYLSDILLLCVECGEPIKARINTSQWLRVEWISPEGQCKSCYDKQKGGRDGDRRRSETTAEGSL